jgi:hypothetical protein
MKEAGDMGPLPTPSQSRLRKCHLEILPVKMAHLQRLAHLRTNLGPVILGPSTAAYRGAPPYTLRTPLRAVLSCAVATTRVPLGLH